MMFCFCGAIGKGGWAEVTLVGSVASVRIHMPHQLLVLNKASTTDSA